MDAMKGCLVDKKDTGKLRTDLVPTEWYIALAEVMTEGAKKYPDHNWKQGFKWSRIVGSILRHLFQFTLGETMDKETGCNHMAHVAWNALALMTYFHKGLGENDLFTEE